jgi:PAS domain S-box-containing protein
MISNSEQKRIQEMIESIKKTLSVDTAAAPGISSPKDALDELAETINTLLKKNNPCLPRENSSGKIEERYRHILDTIEESYFEVDLQGNVLFFNQATLRELSYLPEEISKMSYRQLTDEHNARKVYSVFHHVFLTGETVKAFDWEILRKDGKKIQVESSVALMHDEQGSPCGFRGVVRDVTQRNLAEKRLRLIAENIHDAIWTRDFDLNYTYLSPSIFRLTGYTAEEIMQAPPNSFLPDEDQQRIRQELTTKLAYAQAYPFEKGETFHYEIQTRHKNGDEIWLEISANFNRDENGIPFEIVGITHDITARKKAEAAFAESEKLHRLIVENMQDSITLLDLNLNYIYQSPSEVRITGWAADEIRRIPIHDQMTPESYALARKVMAEEFERELSSEPVDPHRKRVMELEVFSKAGTTIWEEVTASFYRNETGKPIGVLLCSRNITERKKAQQAFAESEKRYRMIVENMHDTIWTMDLNLNYTYQSPSEIRVTGYTPEEIMNIPIDKVLTPESFTRASRLLADELEKELRGEPVDPKRSSTFEVEIYHKNGGTILQEISASFNRDEQGKPVEIMLVGRDITARKKIEAALRESEKRYRMIVENMQDTITLLDMNLQQLYQSPSEIRVTGYTPEEIMKIPIEQQITPESLERAMKVLSEEFEKEFSSEPVDPHRSIMIEVESYRKDGGTVWLEETVTFNRDESGKPIGILLSGRNITERKKAEQERDRLAAQLLHSQKMETVGRLAGGVAHDFNNMLNVILGYTDLARMRLPMENPIYSDLMEIEKAATRSRDLTAQLLAFSRKQIISPRVIDLNALISETQKAITRLIGEDIDLKFYPGDDLWAIKFDPVQIEQILINLAVNARDAMPQGGRLLLETSNIAIDAAFSEAHLDITPGNYVLLNVSDTGTGIQKETIPFVFEPFFTTKDVGKGTGLGLATVYGIIKQNDGFISVSSEPGRGSAFKMYLPRTEEIATIHEKTYERPAAPGSGTILLVEDDEMVLKMVSNMLEALGYMVIATENPQDALSLCERAAAPIDLVITDVVMPQMSGKELRDKLTVLRPELKILFMSGYTSNIIAQHGVLEECTQFIQKPFSIHLLAEKVKQMIAG